MMNVTFSFLETIKWEPHNAKGTGVIILGIISLSIIRTSPIPHLPDQLYVTQWVTAGQQWEKLAGPQGSSYLLFLLQPTIHLQGESVSTVQLDWDN